MEPSRNLDSVGKIRRNERDRFLNGEIRRRIRVTRHIRHIRKDRTITGSLCKTVNEYGCVMMMMRTLTVQTGPWSRSTIMEQKMEDKENNN